jgi:antirestriction protein ArdC
MSNAAIREQVTKTIIAAIERGKHLFWRRPWHVSKNAGRPTSISSRKAYSGVNVPLLMIHSARYGFASKFWATYRQWESLGMQVKKRPHDVEPGEWGASIAFAKPITKKKLNDAGEEHEDKFFLLRTFVVFNADQVENAEKFQVQEPVGEVAPDFAPAEELIAASGAAIRHEGEKAFYVRPNPVTAWPNHSTGDFIVLPPKHRFNPPGAYYETVLHELAHHSEIRLKWPSEEAGYPMNELVAELAASYLSQELGVPQAETLENHAAYIKIWLEAMEGDTSFIFRAATQASKVADFLLAKVQQATVTREPLIVV